MINHKINVAIAEACPDKFRNESGLWFFQYDKDCWMQCHNNSICADLNAMHEAEKVLTFDEWDIYCVHLGDTQPSCAKANARQRAEAFLRTLGKWEEVQP